MTLSNSGEVSIISQIKDFLEAQVTSHVWFRTDNRSFLMDVETDIDQVTSGDNWTHRAAIDHPVVRLMSFQYKGGADFRQADALNEAPFARSTQIVVQLQNSKTGYRQPVELNEYDIRLEIVSWNSGEHANEIYYKTDRQIETVKPGMFVPITEFETKPDVQYIPTQDGWIDVLHLATMIKQALLGCNSGQISENLFLKPGENINISPLGDATGILQLDPFFCVTVEFTVISGLNNRGYFEEDIRDGL